MLGQPAPKKPGAYTGMNPNPLPGSTLTLGGFLRDRRARLQPEPSTPDTPDTPDTQGTQGTPRRRRTPGLRREEIATRAGVSVTTSAK